MREYDILTLRLSYVLGAVGGARAHYDWAMTKRNYDPELEAVIPMLPVLSVSTLEGIQEMRGARGDLFPDPPPDREDVSKEDRTVPGRTGDPDVPIRIYRPVEAAARGWT